MVVQLSHRAQLDAFLVVQEDLKMKGNYIRNNNMHVHTDNNLHEYIRIWTIERTVHKSHYPKQKYTYISIDSYVYTYHFSGIRTKSIIKVHIYPRH